MNFARAGPTNFASRTSRAANQALPPLASPPVAAPDRRGHSTTVFRRSSAAVATSREGHRSPRSGREVPHRRWDRGTLAGWFSKYVSLNEVTPLVLCPSLSCASLDHLVGAQQNGCRERNSQALRGLEVDHQRELRRQFSGQLGRLGAAQHLGHQGCTLTKVVHWIDAIAISPPARANSGNSETAGSRSPSVSPAIRSELVPNTGEDSMSIASAPVRPAARMESSRFAVPRTSKISSFTFNRLPALSTAFICTVPVAGSHKTATLASWGTASFSNSSHFLPNSGKSKNTPVTCPPGRDRLLIQPFAIGSDSKSSATIGMVALAASAACTPAGLTGSMTSTLRSASSTACGAMRFGSPSAARPISSILSGSRYPAACNASRNPARREGKAAVIPG